MKQMVLTAHNGVNLQYPLETLADFVQTHAADSPADRPDLLQQMQYIFTPGEADGGFMVLGLDEEDQLIGVVAVENAATPQTGQHRLLCVALHPNWQGQGHGRALMRSARMLSKREVLLDLTPDHALAGFFIKMGFEPAGEMLQLKR